MVTPVEFSRLSQIQARKSIVLDDLFRHIACESDMPMAAAAWNQVLEDIGHEAEELSALLVDGISPGGEEMVELWRRLEAEVLSLELLATVELIWQLRSKPVLTNPP